MKPSPDKGDLDCGDNTLMIRNTKFGKTRQIPIDPATVAALTGYLAQTANRSPATEALLVSGTGRRLGYKSVNETFRHIVDRCGIGEGLRPSTHTALIQALVRGHHARPVGIGARPDVGALLPVLATYLGFVEPRYTYPYLSATPELMAAAAAKVPAR